MSNLVEAVNHYQAEWPVEQGVIYAPNSNQPITRANFDTAIALMSHHRECETSQKHLDLLK